MAKSVRGNDGASRRINCVSNASHVARDADPHALVNVLLRAADTSLALLIAWRTLLNLNATDLAKLSMNLMARLSDAEKVLRCAGLASEAFLG